MNSTQLSPSGVFPSITWDSIGRRWFCVWQNGPQLEFSDGRVRGIGGDETSFPRLMFRNKMLLTYRDGAPPYKGHLALVNSGINEIIGLGVVHGMYPTVLGNDWVAYQVDGAQAGWPTRRRNLDTGETVPTFTGKPTGLALIDSAGNVRTWDDVGTVGDLHNVSYAGFLMCGATDRAGKPCVVVRDPTNGTELVLWPGEDSQNPTMAWDGASTYAVVAWSAQGQGVRQMTFDASELTLPVSDVPAAPTVHACTKFFGWFFEDGRYGDSNAESNVSIIGRSLFKDGNGQLPADVNERILRAVNEDGGGFIAAGDVRIVKTAWDKIFGVFIHEVGAPADVRWAAVEARAEMSREGVKPRPVVAIITETEALNADFAGSCEVLAPEIYFDEPSRTYDEMYARAKERVANVLAALSPTNVILVSQAYDRSKPSWTGREDQLKAIAQVCFDALKESRVLGIWPFAYNRPGSMTMYTDTLRWYTAQESAMVRPPYPANGGGGNMNENYTPVATPDPMLTEFSERLDKKYSAPRDQSGLGRGPTETFVDPLGRSRWMRDFYIHLDKGDSKDAAWKKVNKAINDIEGLTGDPNFP